MQIAFNSYLKDGQKYSVNVEGGQLTTDVRTEASEQSIRQLLDRQNLLDKLDTIEKIPDGVKLVWNAHTTHEMRDLDSGVRQAAAQISGLRI